MFLFFFASRAMGRKLSGDGDGTGRVAAGCRLLSASGFLSCAAAVLGIGIAELLANWLSGAGQTPLRAFNGTGYLGDFTLDTLETVLPATAMQTITAPPPPVLSNLWQIARDEWVR